jgi:hypothetical protein
VRDQGDDVLAPDFERSGGEKALLWSCVSSQSLPKPLAEIVLAQVRSEQLLLTVHF